MTRTPKVLSITLSAIEFGEAIAKVEHAAARDGSRPILEAVVLDVADDGSARVYAADNYRIAVADLPVREDSGLRGRFPIAIEEVKGLHAHLKPLKSCDVVVTVPTRTQMVVTQAVDAPYPVTFPVRLVDGQYPNIDPVIPHGQPVVVLNGYYLGDLKRIVTRDAPNVHVDYVSPLEPVTFRTAHGVREIVMPVRDVGAEGPGDWARRAQRVLLCDGDLPGTWSVSADTVIGRRNDHVLVRDANPSTDGVEVPEQVALAVRTVLDWVNAQRREAAA